MDIYGLGTLAMDILMKVDRLPGPDSFCVIKSTEVQPGGSGTNVIVQCARLGARCGFIGCVGDDSVGREVLNSLEAEKIETEAMVIREGMTTLHTDIVIDDQGEKFIMLDLGDAFAALGDGDVNMEKILGSKVFYTDLLPVGPAVEALKRAKEAGVKTVFNMQAGMSTMGGFGITEQGILDILKYVDVFAPCAEGLQELTGSSDPEECRKFLRQYTDGILIFTQGKKGSVGFDEADHRCHADIYPVKAVDTTGAGDSYIGSFMVAYYLRGYDLEKAMRFASACSAYTCTGIGARFSPDSEKAEEIFGE